MNRVWENLTGFPAMRMISGRYPLPSKPGLGFEVNEAATQRQPRFQGNSGRR